MTEFLLTYRTPRHRDADNELTGGEKVKSKRVSAVSTSAALRVGREFAAAFGIDVGTIECRPIRNVVGR